LLEWMFPCCRSLWLCGVGCEVKAGGRMCNMVKLYGRTWTTHSLNSSSIDLFPSSQPSSVTTGTVMVEVGTLIVWAGGYTALVFLAVCLATGLYYLAELVEEYTVLTKRLLGWAVIAEVGIYVLLLVVDRLPVMACVSGLVAHLVYGTLLRKFPFISLTSPEFLGSCGACPTATAPRLVIGPAARTGHPRGAGAVANMRRVPADRMGTMRRCISRPHELAGRRSAYATGGLPALAADKSR
jgi:hypothetical protein